MKKLLYLIPALLLFNCEEEENTNLSGTWRLSEPPQEASRINRLDGSIPAFDVLFSISGREITSSDLLIDGQQVDESFHSVDHGQTIDLYFETNDFNLKLLGCKRVGVQMFISTIEYELSGQKQVFKGLSVGPWY